MRVLAVPVVQPFTLLVACTASSLAVGQVRESEVVRPERPVKIDAIRQRVDLIVVKFAEGHEVRCSGGGALVSPTGLDMRTVRAIVGERRAAPVFSRAEEDLEAERAMLEKRGSTRLPDLKNYAYITTRGQGDSEALLERLLDDPCVETAYPAPSANAIVRAMPPDLPPTTPSFESRQSYFGAAPGGFGHVSTRAIDGAQGAASQLLIHLEGAWNLGHEDLPDLVASNVIGTTSFGSFNTNSWRQHGTACLGILHAERNAYGTVGFAPRSSVRVISLANGSANMISMATARAHAGDVFTSSFGYDIGGGRQAPPDWPQADFDAIRIATAKGICYTFSAGNSGLDLATFGSRYAATAPESGGFIIGATAPSASSRISFSNHGAKVIANGWGSSVVTTGYGDLFQFGDDRQDYTATFGGTSAAAPIVAGVIASLQSAHRRQNGRYLTPDEVRSLLRTTGTTVSGSIGNRPDLLAMMRATKTLDGMRVTTEPVVGGRLEIEISAAAGRVFVALGAAGRANIALGLNRDLLVDPATLMPIATGQIAASGTQVLSWTIPNDAALAGAVLFGQTAHAGVSDPQPRLSNSVEVSVR